MVRLTFVGDIALDKPLLKAAKRRGKDVYDFSDVFHTEDIFAGSDLVIGNLETCFGGGHRFNSKPYHYNSPDSFCQAIKEAGIGLVSTANNHCTDEGVYGIRRTLEQLDKCGIEHTGTFASETKDRYLIKEIKSIRVAFYSLTYSVNPCLESLGCGDLYRYVNLTGFSGRRGSKAKQYLSYVLKPKIKQKLKKWMGKSTIASFPDTFKIEKIRPEWMADIETQIQRARERSDFLVVLLHSGGQFNIEPGEYSKFIMDRLLELGADIVVGNHPHTVQRIENRDGKVAAFSLGGYCMSVSGEYLVHDCLPEYSLALHVELDEKGNIADYRVDVLKGTEDEKGYLNVKGANDAGASEIRIRAGFLS